MAALTPVEMAALRQFAEYEIKPKPEIALKLFVEELIDYGPSDEPDDYEVTERGREIVAQYVLKTGDGPEDLKAKLRF